MITDDHPPARSAYAALATAGDPRTPLTPRIHRSSICLGRIVGVVFMPVNSKCAHQVRPPPSRLRRNAAVGQRLVAKPIWRPGAQLNSTRLLVRYQRTTAH